MRNPYFIFIMIIFLSGCASIEYNYKPSSTDVTSPNLNTVKTVSIGDEVLVQGNMTQTKFLDLKNDVEVFDYTADAGLYRKIGQDNQKTYYSSTSSKGKSIDKKKIKGIYVAYDDTEEICLINMLNVALCVDADFEEVNRDDSKTNTVRKAIYFSGIKDNQLAILYTERQGQKTVHSHEVSYDLAHSKIINFKGAQIEILSHQQHEITYKILKYFNN